MKRLIESLLAFSIVAFIAILFCSAQQSPKGPAPRKYRLVWQDDFNKGKLDTTKWNKIDRMYNVAWAKYMSHNDRLFQFKGNYLRLYAIANNGIEPKDTAKFLTAGISTRHKVTVKYGKIEVRARIHGAQGCWPAIWTKADDYKYWNYPERPEIDIMEHYNYDAIVHQTVHSHYTVNLKKTKNPVNTNKAEIRKNQFNVYAVEILPERIIFSVNGKDTFVYPRLDLDKGQWQYPFFVDQFLMIDMQVGNSALKVDKNTYPAYMDVDWVKIYTLNNYE